MKAYPLVPIRKLTDRVNTWNPSRVSGERFCYIDLSAIDRESKSIVGQVEIDTEDAPSRARQIVTEGDVLVSTVRPNLNAVALVGADLIGATASTGFTVLRPSTALDANYLFQWVRSPNFVAEMVRKATGASYPAISDAIVFTSEIPLPPLVEQRRIVSVLDEADALTAKCRQSLLNVNNLPQAIFIDMFGDPVTNERHLPLKPLEELGVLDRGVSKHRPRNDPRLLGGKHPLIQTGDVANSGGTIRAYSTTYSELGLQQSRLWPVGTLCITIAANIAKTGILTFPACFPDSVVGFTADEPTTAYVKTWFLFMQKTLEAAAPMSAQRNINLAILRSLPVPVPPLRERKDFSDRVTQVELTRDSLTSSLEDLQELFGAFQHQAFSGQLRLSAMIERDGR